ncbi:MAG: hypothetical protein ACRD2S_10585 [Terriglobales bacterium]
MDQRFSLDRTSFERFLATASLLQQLQKRTTFLNSHLGDVAPQLADLVSTQQAIQTGTLSGEAALLRISALALRLVPAQGAGIWLFSGDLFLYRAGAGTASNDEGLSNAVSSRLASYDGSADIHQDYVEAWPPLVRSLLLAPIYQGQKIAGALAVFSEIAGCFSDRDETTARLLSGLAAHALDKAANARFKQTMTLEREAVLHVIEALVPSLKMMVETKPHTGRPLVDGVNSVVHGTNTVGESCEIPDPLVAAIQPHEEVTFIPEETKFLIAQATLGSLPSGSSELETSAAVSDLYAPPQPQPVTPVRELKDLFAEDAVHGPPRGLDESAGFADGIFETARYVRESIAALHLRTMLVASFQRSKSSSVRVANLMATSLHDLLAHVSERELFAGRRLATLKRFGPAIALMVVAAIFLVKTVVSELRFRSAKAAATVSLPVSSTKTVKNAVADGSHKRVTDDSTSATLADLSRFEIPGLLRQARYGDSSAAFLIGMAYETGRGLPQNCEKAAHWVKEAADDGEAAAEYNLSLRYRDGDGLLANSEESEKWLQRAAAQKYPQALAKTGADQTNQIRAASSNP